MIYNYEVQQNKVQVFQNITHRKIANALFYVSINLNLHQDFVIKSIEREPTIFYKRFFSKLENHQNPLVKNLRTLTLPGNLGRRLKKKMVLRLFDQKKKFYLMK